MIRVLHISDLHYDLPAQGASSHHAFRSPDGFADTKLSASNYPKTTMVDAILLAIPEDLKPIDVLVVTGDITWKAKNTEFGCAEMELARLCSILDIPRDHVLIIPGNHDVDWNESEFRGKFFEFCRMFRAVVGKSPTDNLNYKISVSSSTEVIQFVGINSAIIESQQDSGMGVVGDESLRQALLCDSPKPLASDSMLSVTVVCMHHHVLPVSYVERDYFENGGKRTSITLDAKAALEICLKNNVSIILHGHQHQPSVVRYSSLNPLKFQGDHMPAIWVIGAGSTGVERNHLGDVARRHFQILAFENRNGNVICDINPFVSETENQLGFERLPPTMIDLQLSVPVNQQAEMGSSLLLSEGNKRLVIHGAKQGFLYISRAIGPCGTPVVIDKEGQQIPYRQGLAILQNMASENSLEVKGMKQMRFAAQETFNAVGDGTKTAVILACAMLSNGYEAISNGYLKQDVISGMDRAVKTAMLFIAAKTQTVGDKDYSKLAITAAMDEKIGGIVADAFSQVGQDGQIFIKEPSVSSVPLTVLDGMRFNVGYLSELFITDVENYQCVLENCFVLLYDRVINSMKDLLPIMEQVARSGRPLLVIADDVGGEALATLTTNKLRGTLSSVAVRSPKYNYSDNSFLNDIAVLTGAKIPRADLGMGLVNLTLNDLGRANKVIVTNSELCILEGGGSFSDVQNYVKRLKKDLQEAKNTNIQRMLQRRLANFAGKVAVITPSEVSAVDVSQEQYRLHSALNAVKAAIKEGWCLGGGITFLQAKQPVDQLVSGNQANIAGVHAVSQALEQPIRCLIETIEKDSPDIFLKIEKEQKRTPNVGFNVVSRKIEDLLEAGVLDSAKTLCQALEYAFSHAKTLLEGDILDTRYENNQEKKNARDLPI